MGNQLVGIAPSQIFPVEHYLTDLTDLEFDVNLGSTRFLKVARAKSQEGLQVVKVFAIHDPTLPLSTHKVKLEEIRSKLASAVNCLPFQRISLNEKAGLMMREYVKYSLYDRISTRPFLSMIEKKWIAFQVLYALHQCHKLGVCHGDIKLENIMITSWNWVLLTDFASYKPTYLPEDNPADFSYFFDTSRRRTCYIAPERFIKTLSSEITSQLLLPEEDLKGGDLTPSMDIFSAGCALTELFNEGHPPFDFSQLLAYRSGEYSTSKMLDRVEDPEIRELLGNMMEKDPSLRQSAETILAQQRGKVFPEYFYGFLQSYMLIFSAAPILAPDEKISRLKKDIKNIVKILQCEDQEVKQDDSTSTTCEQKPGAASEGLVIITSLVTSCIRGLRHCSSKLYCLEILKELSAHTSSETILDRILPYIFHLLHDPEPRVRVMAIRTLNFCLAAVQSVPMSDVNIFPEYVLPNLLSIYQDEAVLVRAAYAENIAQLAETALRFLDQSQQENRFSPSEGNTRPSYETELNILMEMIQQTVAMLLKDPENLVRQTLLENGITRLCVFFGRQRAHDILLSHMITFLNDKEDKHLRGTFFDSIIGVAAYVGWHGTTVLLPLLQQGLSDPEEFVIVKAINAVTSLTELGLIQKMSLFDMLHDMACFLVHPNLWIRQAVVGFVNALGKTLELVDVQCKVVAAIRPYVENSVSQVENDYLLLSSLTSPVPRAVYDSVVKCPDIVTLLQTLAERKENRLKLLAGHLPLNDIPPQFNSLFRRLLSEGMTEKVEEQLLAMTDHLRKIHQRQLSIPEPRQPASDGVIDLNALSIPFQSIDLVIPGINDVSSLHQARARMKKTLPFEPPELVMNEEWRHMFGTAEPHTPPNTRTSEGGSSSPVGGSSVNTASTTVASPLIESVHLASPQQSLDTDQSIQEKSFIQYRCAPCRAELRELMMRKQVQYADAVRGVAPGEWGIEQPATWELKQIPPPGWRLRGLLVSHMHEHRGAVNRVVAVPESPLFASCSQDGCIRLWDCSKLEGRNVANRSSQMYNRMGGPLVGLAVCENNQSLASAAHNGSVFVTRFDVASSKMVVTHSKQLDLQEDGCAVDIQYFDSGSQSVVVYATMYGSIIGWDLRSPNPAWILDNDLKHGVITTFCVDSRQSWLTLGTSSGYHICWDLRFQLPISTIPHPNGARVRKLVKHPSEQSWVLSAVQGNNEISMWNLETGVRECVLWASHAPPLSQTQVCPHSVCGMCTGLADRGTPFLLTGGTDMRIRFWDLNSPSESYIAVPAVDDTVSPSAVLYKSRLVDGNNVVQEVCLKYNKRARGSLSERTSSGQSGTGPREAMAGLHGDTDTPQAGPEQPASGHHDWISEVAMCQASQCFMVTGSRDGVIKVWK